jgi:hypothetical protein
MFLVKILKFFDADPESGMEKIRIRDPGWENLDPGWKKFGAGIRDKHPRSATLVLPSIHPYRRRKKATERDKSRQSNVFFSSMVR